MNEGVNAKSPAERKPGVKRVIDYRYFGESGRKLADDKLYLLCDEDVPKDEACAWNAQ